MRIEDKLKELSKLTGVEASRYRTENFTDEDYWYVDTRMPSIVELKEIVWELNNCELLQEDKSRSRYIEDRLSWRARGILHYHIFSWDGKLGGYNKVVLTKEILTRITEDTDDYRLYL